MQFNSIYSLKPTIYWHMGYNAYIYNYIFCQRYNIKYRYIKIKDRNYTDNIFSRGTEFSINVHSSVSVFIFKADISSQSLKVPGPQLNFLSKNLFPLFKKKALHYKTKCISSAIFLNYTKYIVCHLLEYPTTYRLLLVNVLFDVTNSQKKKKNYLK